MKRKNAVNLRDGKWICNNCWHVAQALVEWRESALNAEVKALLREAQAQSERPL